MNNAASHHPHFFTLLLAAILPLASTATPEEDFTYTVSSGQATITGYYGPDNVVSIPATLGGYPVTYIGGYAFQGCTALTSVTIPDSVTSIGDLAFSSCTSLTSVTIPDSVTCIGSSAFKSCTALTSGTIPDCITNYYHIVYEGNAYYGSGVLVSSPAWWNAFKEVASLTNITVASTNPEYTSIDGILFDKSVSAMIFCPEGFSGSLTIPDSVTSIGEKAFSGCESLTSVTIPNSVTSIGDDAFSFCDSLASVLFTGDAPTIAPFAFDATPATIYHLPGTTGWGTPVNGLSPVSWNPAFSPASTPRFTSGEFAFTLTGNANIPVRIEACDSLTNPSWSTVTDTVIPASGTLDFSDPAASSRPSRFYRITFPQ